MNNLVDKLTEQYPSFSKGKSLLRFYTKAYDQAAFMTLPSLVKKLV